MRKHGKTITLRIAPFGIISMGGISLADFAMGIVNLKLIGKSIFSSWITTMGVLEYSPIAKKHNHQTDNSNFINIDLINEIKVYETR